MVVSTIDNGIITATIDLELDSVDELERLGINAEASEASIDFGQDVRAKVTHIEKGLGFLESIDMTMVLSFSIGVGSGVVANLIYAAIGSGIQKIALNGRRVRPNKEDLIDALQSTIDLLKEQDKSGGK